MMRFLAWMTTLHRWLHRLGTSSTDALEDDPGATLRSVLRAAHQQRGLVGLCWSAVCETADLAVAVVQARRDARRERRAPRTVGRWFVLARDMRFALRDLWASRSTSALVVVTLALGIGINAGTFSLLSALVWRPVPFAEPERLTEIWNYSTRQKFSYSGVSPAMLEQWRLQSDLFTRVEGYTAAQLIYEGAQGAEMVPGARITPGLMEMLGVAPAAGRTFVDGDGAPGAPPVAVVSHRFWTDRLGRRALADDVTVAIDGRPHRVIGVMPLSFRFPTAQEVVWLPPDATSRGWILTPMARLVPTMTVADVEALVRARGPAVFAAAGGPPDVTGMLSSVGSRVDARTRTSMFVLAATVAGLFLVVCVNVANLVLARALRRAPDVATHIALGASRGALIRTVLFEQTMLAGLGVLLGAVVAAGVLRVARTALPDSMTASSLQPLQLDWQTWMFLALGGLVATMLSALVPAWLAAGATAGATLSRERASAGSQAGRRWRSVLVVAEVAVSIVLLIGAALMARSFTGLAAQSPGFEPRALHTFELGFPAATYADASRRHTMVGAIAERVAALPSVDAVAVGSLPSEARLIAFSEMEFSNRPHETIPRSPIPLHEVSHNYFSVLQLPIVAGRSFQPGDEDVLIVNRRFAMRFFKTDDPVGLRMRLTGGPWRTVVGVAGDTLADRERGEQRVEMYVPLGRATEAFRPTGRATRIAEFRTLMVRAASPEIASRELTAAVHAEDPAVVAWKVASVERVLGGALARPRVVLAAMSVCAVSGLMLAVVGLYGVLSYLVAQRRREIGVRLALGANRTAVRSLIYRQGLWLTLVGTGIGVVAAWPMTRLLESLLVDVHAADPTAIGAAALLMVATALAATWWPARDASRVDPASLLRGE